MRVELYTDKAYYNGFSVKEQEIGLDPNGHKSGIMAYYHVNDIRQSPQSPVEMGAQIQEEIKDVGGGRLIATAKETEGNIFGLLQPGELERFIPTSIRVIHDY